MSEPARRHHPWDEALRDLGPQVLGVLVRRGAEFGAAEDAVQEALLEAVRRWGAPGGAPSDPKGWLVTVAWRKFVDARRSESARAQREIRVTLEPPSGPTEQADDTLLLLSRCCHPAQVARAFLVPEATMAQRISRAKKTVAQERFGEPGDVRAVLRVLYLIFNEGFTDGPSGPPDGVDLAGEAIRLARQLVAAVPDDAEAAGLLALLLLHHARRDARTTAAGELVPLDRQDRSLWDTAAIAEGVALLQGALARDSLGPYQIGRAHV